MIERQYSRPGIQITRVRTLSLPPHLYRDIICLPGGKPGMMQGRDPPESGTREVGLGFRHSSSM